MTGRSQFTLALLRHAKALPDAASDELRELAPRGFDQLAQTAAQLEAHGVIPDIAYVSSAIRTRQTWAELSKHLDLADCPVTFHDELYTAGVQDVLDIVYATDSRHRVILVVGHEPTMSMTARALAGPNADPVAASHIRLGMSTAHVSVIESSQPWSSTNETRLRQVLGPLG